MHVHQPDVRFCRLFSVKINFIMKKYLAVFRVNWQKSFEYRADFFGHMGIGIISFLVMYFIWSAIFKERETFNGYTFSSMMTYVLLTRFLHFVQRGNIGRMVANEIKEGQLSSYLLKPVSYIKWWLSIFLADRFFESFVRFTMLISLFILLPEIVIFSGTGKFILFLFFLLFSLMINFIINILVASLAFWITDVRLFRSTIMIIIDFFAGALVPLDVMPGVLKKIGYLLPFKFTAFFPIKLYQGTISSSEIYFGILEAGAWIAAMFLILAVIWKRGLKNYEAVGQ